MNHNKLQGRSSSSTHLRPVGLALDGIGLVAALATLVLFADLWLHNDPSSPGLCVTAGCRIAGQSLRLGEIPLMITGIIFFALTTLLVLLHRQRNSSFTEKLLVTLVFGGLAFDGTLLGYQFLVLKTFCQVCVGVGTALCIIAMLLALARKSAGMFCWCMAVWAGAASAIFFLALTPPTPEQAATIQFRTGNTTSDSLTYHLFYSNYCEQCESVLAILAATNPTHVAWNISCADTDDKSLSRLTTVWNQRNATTNMFAALLNAKHNAPSSAPIPTELRQQARNARTFLMNKGYTGVPLIIARKGAHQKTIVEGKFSLITFLQQEQVLDPDNPLVNLLTGTLPGKFQEKTGDERGQRTEVSPAPMPLLGEQPAP